MMANYMCFVFLIFAVSAIMTHSFNKVGYAFTLLDWLVLSLLGTIAFTVPMLITYFLISIMR